jgi:hypothetical protein
MIWSVFERRKDGDKSASMAGFGVVEPMRRSVLEKAEL